MIQNCIGWILDVYIEHDQAILWVKTQDGQVLRLIDDYDPVFYIHPKDEKSGEEIFQILSDMELIKEIKWEHKFIDIGSNVKQKLLYVRCYSIHHYNLLLKTLQHETIQQRIRQLYNTKLSHIQRYLFTQLMIPSTTQVTIEYQDGELVSIREGSEREDLQLPFTVMHVEVIPFTEQEVLDRDDPIKSITITYNSDSLILEDNESKVLEDFSHYVISKDPDIIVFVSHDSHINMLNYLLERIKSLLLDLPIGRRKTDIYSVDQGRVLERWTQGRVYLNKSYNNGLVSLRELSRFSYLPIRMILQYSLGRLIANRNQYELTARGHVISDNYRRTHEKIRTVEEIVDKDKAGMIFSPKIGLHENVAVLDYNDEFANIIVNENISYETGKNSPEQNKSQLGILPNIVKQLLERRTYFKELMKQLPTDSLEAKCCEERTDALKKILVCLYGTTGSYWNKYGNVLAFEAINKKSREILLKTKDIVQELGYELIYADTDAAFVRKDGATRDDYEKLGNIISAKTGLALSLEYHYKFLVLLPLEADEKLEALKHYFGKTFDGELVTRGIETRRHDTPEFIKRFQTELLYILFDCDKSDDIFNKTLETALFCLTKTIDKIMTGEIDRKDLIISKQLGMDISKYRNIFPHVAAAIQLGNVNGKRPTRGEIIQYIYTDSQHQNPLNRVVTAGIDANFGIDYDREKYKEMLLDAAETVLGIFGFERTLYGKAKDKKWWIELRRNRMLDMNAEQRG